VVRRGAQRRQLDDGPTWLFATQISVDDRLFGRNGPGNFFTGALDHTRIYYRAISPTEVSALFNE